MDNSKILLIYTGGTIGMKADPETGLLVPFDFNDIYEEFPYFRKLGVELDFITLKPIDSSNVTPELWVTIAEIIRDNYNAYDGFVVLHGTDTMCYSASALSFMLENLDKPVVFTGSQIPISVLRTDGRENLMTSIEIAAAKKDGRAVVPEVSLLFQNTLYRGNRTIKYSAEDLDAFKSVNYPPLAEVGVNIHYNNAHIYKIKQPTTELRISTSLETAVLVVSIFPGMSRGMLSSITHIEGLKAIVLETYGAGNAPSADWFIDTVKDAMDRGIIVVNVTQCPSGSVFMERYETGAKLHKIGIINGRDITTEAALAKLMYLLGKQLPPSQLNDQLRRAIRGEFTTRER